jgi:hypothetical protein
MADFKPFHETSDASLKKAVIDSSVSSILTDLPMLLFNRLTNPWLNKNP